MYDDESDYAELHTSNTTMIWHKRSYRSPDGAFVYPEDDAEAIQAAFDRSNGWIYFHPGSYSVHVVMSVSKK
jgi:hypothetical protein